MCRSSCHYSLLYGSDLHVDALWRLVSIHGACCHFSNWEESQITTLHSGLVCSSHCHPWLRYCPRYLQHRRRNEHVTHKKALEDASDHLFVLCSPCWHIDLAFNWMYKGPCIVSVFINLVFLCWIVYVLVSKFHADISDHAAMVKTAKAIGLLDFSCLIWVRLRVYFLALLVPLFGLHHFIAAFKPDDDETTRCIIEIISAVAISFQVSLTFGLWVW